MLCSSMKRNNRLTWALVPRIKATRQFSLGQITRWSPPNHLGVGPTNQCHRQFSLGQFTRRSPPDYLGIGPRIKAIRQFLLGQITKRSPLDHSGVGPPNQSHKVIFARLDHKVVSAKPLGRWSYESMPQGTFHQVKSQAVSIRVLRHWPTNHHKAVFARLGHKAVSAKPLGC